MQTNIYVKCIHFVVQGVIPVLTVIVYEGDPKSKVS